MLKHYNAETHEEAAGSLSLMAFTLREFIDILALPVMPVKIRGTKRVRAVRGAY